MAPIVRDEPVVVVVEKLMHLSSCVNAGGGLSDEINLRIVKVEEAYYKLGGASDADIMLDFLHKIGFITYRGQ